MQPLISPIRLFKYSITFQETTEDSREVSDFSDSGYIIENETDTIGNILKKANEVYGIYYPISFGGWESTYPEQDRDYFEKGIEKYYALFIKNEDGTDITTEEYDFITYLLSNGQYNSEEFQEYAVGGLIAGAVGLGVVGLIAYYYFNKKDRSYPTGRAWTKEHYNDNDDENYEIEPSRRNPKHRARNRQYENGGGVESEHLENALNMLNYYLKDKGSRRNFNEIKKEIELSKNENIIELANKISIGTHTKTTDFSDLYYSIKGVLQNQYGKQYANGGGVDNTFVNVLLDYGFVEKRSAYGVRHFYNKSKDFYASLDNNLRKLYVYKDDNLYVQGREYSGYSIQGLIDFLNSNGFKRGNKFDNGGTTTTRPTTTPEVVPDTDTKPRKPKTPFQPKHIPKPKARKYDFILIKK